MQMFAMFKKSGVMFYFGNTGWFKKNTLVCMTTLVVTN